eukprot:3031793-Pleurochrysis_carterae.AAC.1
MRANASASAARCTPRRSLATSPRRHAALSASVTPKRSGRHHALASSSGQKTRGVCACVRHRVAARPWACPSCRSSSAATRSPCRRRNVTAIPRASLKHERSISVVAKSEAHSGVETSASCHREAKDSSDALRASACTSTTAQPRGRGLCKAILNKARRKLGGTSSRVREGAGRTV